MRQATGGEERDVTHLIDLSHEFGHGYGSYVGVPQPVIRDHMTFEQSVAHYDPGTEFSIKVIEMVANSGTYLDTPAHRHRDGYDLAALPLERVAGVPGIVIDATGPAITAPLPSAAAGRAILFRTGWSRHWGTPAYGAGGHPHLTAAMAEALVAAAAAVVGIDSHNIDDTSGGSRPAHTALLAAGVPIVEHLTGLEELPASGFEFFAVPPRVAGMGTFPVRAFALVR
jgi:arylformamidase